MSGPAVDAPQRHIGFTAPAFPSHWRALEALAHVLRSRGHRVTFFHQPDAAALLDDPAIGFRAIGARSHPSGSLPAVLRRAASPGSPLGLRRVIQDMAAATDMLCRELPQALRDAGVDLLVCDQMEAAGGLVAEAAGIPCVSVACALPINREPGIPLPVMPWRYAATPRDHEVQRASTQVYDHMMGAHARVIQAHAQAFGITPRSALHECLSPLAQISQTTPSFDFPRRALPAGFHAVGPLRPAHMQVMPELGLSAQRPFVFASLGTLQGQRRVLLGRIARACLHAEVQVLIAHCGGLTDPEAGALRVPGRVWVTDFAPQQAVLARADAVISHAGLNTALDACAAGKPVLALPIAFDQPGVAARLVHAGAGLKASPRWASSRTLGTLLRRLLDEPAFAANARRLGAEIAAAGGAERAADIIEQVAVHGVPLHAHAA